MSKSSMRILSSTPTAKFPRARGATGRGPESGLHPVFSGVVYNNTPLSAERWGLQRFSCGITSVHSNEVTMGQVSTKMVSAPTQQEVCASSHTRARLAPYTRAPRPLPVLLRCAEGGWLRPQAEEALRKAARDGDLATLKRLVEMGVSVNAEDE
eukprot:scaffold8186_cov59-Phaeocystis_antarctica.AAC.3